MRAANEDQDDEHAGRPAAGRAAQSPRAVRRRAPNRGPVTVYGRLRRGASGSGMITGRVPLAASGSAGGCAAIPPAAVQGKPSRPPAGAASRRPNCQGPLDMAAPGGGPLRGPAGRRHTG
jgi:hypothetical protein